ncbi:sugar phosphate isomerase/epimerase [bacterium]|nr:sugar phosphate isomerase/epimerase [bacterium]RQV97812.1 MAG: sugar phosphate isomerase/epimerase [bacterium]
MKDENKKRGKVTRREFLGTTAAAAALSTVPFHIRCASAHRSMFGGVQMGAITYSFRSMEDQSATATLDYCIRAGLGTVELMGTGIEAALGMPEGPPRPRLERGVELTAVQQAEYDAAVAEYEAALPAVQAEQREWRQTVGTPEKYAEIRKMFNDAGVDIHIYKWTAGNTEEELDYSFKVAKALGAVGITTEGPRQPGDESAYSMVQTMGSVAEQNGMYCILHNHGQYHSMTIEDIEGILDLSPAVRLNFDCGHYFGYGYDSTGEVDVIQFIEHFAGMGKIVSIHCKDKTGPNTDPPNQNQVWGQGETPLAEVLLLVKNKYPNIYCDIELEYSIPAWSDPVKEVRNCINWARQVLI